MIQQKEFSLPPFRRGFHLVTDIILESVGELPGEGIMNVFIHHTSAGLTINENADPSVRRDLDGFFDHIAPEGLPFITHTLEGTDDMPAHVKSSVAGVSLTIPISKGKLKLGTWQGIYLCEFRNNGGSRKITVTLFY